MYPKVNPNFPYHPEQHMAVCGLSLHLAVRKAAKLYNKNLSFKLVPLIHTVSTGAFHSNKLFCFFRHHIPTNSVAQFFAYKHTHTTHNFSIRSDERLTLETSALKLFTVTSSVRNTKLPCYILPPTQHHSFL